MDINRTPYRAIHPVDDSTAVKIIDQTKLPHIFEDVRLESMRDRIFRIKGGADTSCTCVRA